MKFSFLKLALSAFSVLLCLINTANADSHLSNLCIRDAQETFKGVNDPEIVKMVEEIKTRFADFRDYTLIECNLIKNIVAKKPNLDEGLPQNNFIIFNKTWLQLATANDKTQLYFLLGHEIGHFSAGHFSSPLPRREKERQADGKGACAVAHLGGDWGELLEILTGLRADVSSGDYPTVHESKAIAKQAFEGCGGKTANISKFPRTIVEAFDIQKNTEGRLNDRITLTNKHHPTLATLEGQGSIKAWFSMGAPAIEEIKDMWEASDDRILTFLDTSSSTNGGVLVNPKFSGMMYAGSFSDIGKPFNMIIPRGKGFSNELLSTGNQTAIVGKDLTYSSSNISLMINLARLKHAIETGQNPDVIDIFYTEANNALTDLLALNE